jgi:hypothetical protein
MCYKGVTRVLQTARGRRCRFARVPGWEMHITLLWVLQGCYERVTRVLQGCYKGVLRVLRGSYKGVTRVLQGCYKEVTRVLQGCYKSVTRVLQGCTPCAVADMTAVSLGTTWIVVMESRETFVTRVLRGCYKSVNDGEGWRRDLVFVCVRV